MKQSSHYWRIHAKVTLRLWTDISNRLRDIIAADFKHETEEYKWFASKVDADSQRLYEDTNYYYNNVWTFRYSLAEQLALAA